jgi:two-component system, LytTR family, response regulator
MKQTSIVRTLIADDEPPARDRIKALLARDTCVNIVGECSDGNETLDFIRSHPVDLLFLDIQMPERSGVDLLRELDPGMLPAIIFVTAYDRYAIDAFDLSAIDYLLKPFDDDRFFRSLKRAKESLTGPGESDLQQRIVRMLDRYERSAIESTHPADTFIRTLMVKFQNKTLLVPVDEIDWMEAADNYVIVHLASGKSFPLRRKIGEIARRLDPGRFFRIHRSGIANLAKVREIQPYAKGDFVVILTNGTRLPLSRLRYSDLKALLA